MTQILYAVYKDGHLVDQVAGATQDTALAKLKMDYPGLSGEVVMEIIDNNYDENPYVEVKKEEPMAQAEPMAEVGGEVGPKPMTVITADKLEINITVSSGSISQEDIKAIEKAAEEGMLIAKKKGN